MKKDNVFYNLFRAIALLHFIGAIFLFPQAGIAQSESEKGLPFITNYAAKTFKALPQVWCVQEDDRGMMYFGIQNYILEYDGIKWKKISQQGLLQSIPPEYRNFLDVWTTYTTKKGIYFQSREYIFRLSEKKPDGTRDAKVWKPNSKFMFAFDLADEYYVHQQGLGLYKMINDSLILIPGSEFLGKERMQVMLPYPAAANGEKQWLVGMFYSGLYIYNGKTFRPFTTEADGLIKSGTLVYKGLLLKNGNYVLSTTGKGLVIINSDGKLVNLINRNVGLQDESVYGIYQDKKGILWLALDNGISRVEIASPFSQFTLQSGISTSVLSMARLGGTIYIGTTNGVLVYDSSRKYFEPVMGMPQNQAVN